MKNTQITSFWQGTGIKQQNVVLLESYLGGGSGYSSPLWGYLWLE